MPLNFQTLTQEIEQEIEFAINQLGKDYGEIQGLILTEDDLKCLLYIRLSDISSLKQIYPTKDIEIKTKMVHAELYWYGRDGKLEIKPDLTIIDPVHLKIYPSDDKRFFEFGGNAIIFELKFIRNFRGITEQEFRKMILPDYEKIQNMQHDPENDVLAYQVIFSRAKYKCQEFEEFLSQNENNERHRIIFKSA